MKNYDKRGVLGYEKHDFRLTSFMNAPFPTLPPKLILTFLTHVTYVFHNPTSFENDP